MVLSREWGEGGPYDSPLYKVLSRSPNNSFPPHSLLRTSQATSRNLFGFLLGVVGLRSEGSAGVQGLRLGALGVEASKSLN